MKNLEHFLNAFTVN